MFGLKKKSRSTEIATNTVVGSPGHVSRRYENEKIKQKWIAEFRAILLANPDMVSSR